jgi:hypothetical protein
VIVDRQGSQRLVDPALASWLVGHATVSVSTADVQIVEVEEPGSIGAEPITLEPSRAARAE